MRTNHYRTISHWFWWEDLDFPNPGVEENIRKRVAAAAAAKVELAVVFGYHFRWDYVYNFDLVHKLIKFTVDEYHKYGIKVIDHHSAVLTYRPRNWADREMNFNENHHHVPMTPDPAIIDDLYYAGKQLNSFRQRKIDDNTPIFLPSYHSECYCVNNPDFRYAYRAYVQRLFSETGIDGLMCDDVAYYARWGACGCEHCRKLFNLKTGKTLPAPTDFSFWGNYDNPDFRVWVDMHITNGRNFLEYVRESIPKDAILTTCCSSSVHKANDCSGLDMSVWKSALNTVMLEMCGNISGGKNSIETRIPDMQLNIGVAEESNMACLGMGYAFFPDEGFRTWSLDKFFNSDVWISSHKTRCGLTFAEQCELPDEPEIVHEAYNFDAKYPELSELDDVAETAVYFSSASRNFNGSYPEDYAVGFEATVKALFRANVVSKVLCTIPENADKIKYLILTENDCMSQAERETLSKYLASGGKLIITGLCGARDESGADNPEGSWLRQFGVDPVRPVLDRTLSDEEKVMFFDYRFWEISGSSPKVIEYKTSAALPAANEYGFYALSNNVLWTPRRSHDDGQADNIAAMLKSFCNEPLNISVPENVQYRIYTDKNGDYVVHFLPINATANYHPMVRLHKTGNQIVESLNLEQLTGNVEISGAISSAKLYAADLDSVKDCPVVNGTTTVDLKDLKRFFSIAVKR